jgi:plasmid stabilization system protein ParE
MKVRYTATAAREFANGIEYLAQHAPSIVAKFAEAIERSVKEVAEYVRRFRYAIFYAVENDEIVVLHVRHAAQRLPWEEER